jgi:hypothetical protein
VIDARRCAEAIAAVEREIRLAALGAGIEADDRRATDALLAARVSPDPSPRQRARSRLRGLLFLRLDLEARLRRSGGPRPAAPGRPPAPSP